jgi:amino acid transporter
MIYGIVCITLIVLRKKKPEQTGFFKIKYGKIIALLGLALTFWLLSSATLKQLKHISIAVGIGLVVYLLMEISKRIRSKK